YAVSYLPHIFFIRADLLGPAIVAQGLVELILFQIRVASVEEGVEVIGVKAYRPVTVSDRAIRFAGFHEILGAPDIGYFRGFESDGSFLIGESESELFLCSIRVAARYVRKVPTRIETNCAGKIQNC